MSDNSDIEDSRLQYNDLANRFAALGLSLTQWQQTLQEVERYSDEQVGAPSTLWVGFSGGVDSCLLLSLINDYFRRIKPAVPQRLVAIHVNHQLQAQSDDWARWCQAWCAARDIAIVVENVSVSSVIRAQSGLESAARDARYAAFRAHVRETDLLVLAHHADDQLETILMRWLRGAGVDGLAGMTERSALGAMQLWRPLLGVPRQAMQDMALTIKLDWQEDPSNASKEFDRNYLRHEVIPLLKARWPAVLKTVSRTGVQVQSARDDIAALADRLIDQAIDGHGVRDHLGQAPDVWGNSSIDLAQKNIEAFRLPISLLRGLSQRLQATVLRRWLMRSGCADLDAKHLETILRTVVYARADAQPEFIVRHWCIRRYQDNLYLTAVEQAIDGGHESVECEPFCWRPHIDASVPWAGGVLECCAPTEIPSIFGALGCGDASIMVVSRASVGSGKLPKRLKQRFQEKGIPAWRRDEWPVLQVVGEVINVPSLWCSKELEGALKDYPGLSGKALFRWRC